MTIKRIVNGVEMEFELTSKEMCDIHNEWHHHIDIAWCEQYFYDHYHNEKWYPYINNKLMRDIIEDAAERMKCYVECNYNLNDATAHAFKQTIIDYYYEIYHNV